jgi:hypothetical protein
LFILHTKERIVFSLKNYVCKYKTLWVELHFGKFLEYM